MNCILICRFSHVTRRDTNPPNYGSNLSNPQLVHKEVSRNRTRSALLEKDRQAMQVPEQAVGQPVWKWTAIFFAQRDHHTANGAPEMSALVVWEGFLSCQHRLDWGPGCAPEQILKINHGQISLCNKT